MPKRFVKTTCFISYPIFFLVSVSLFKVTGINLFNNSLSYLGSVGRFGKYFDVTLVIVGILQFLIFLSLFLHRKLKPIKTDIIPVALLSVTTIAGILTGIVTNNVSKEIH